MTILGKMQRKRKMDEKIIDVISQEEFYKLQVAVLEELKAIRELLENMK